MTVRRVALVRRREFCMLTQEMLAQRVGVSRTTVQRWENGECVPSLLLRSGLAAALRVSERELEELVAARVTPKPVAAVACVRDAARRVLVVKDRLSGVWDLPGGMCHERESPIDTVRRELASSCGLALGAVHLVCVDWRTAAHDTDEVVTFVFDGGTVDATHLRLDATHIADWRFERDRDAATMVKRTLTPATCNAQPMACTYLHDGTDPGLLPR